VTPTWRELAADLDSELGGLRHETRLVLLSSTPHPWAFLAAHLDEKAEGEAVALARRKAAERRSGVPLQWVVGAWGFRGIDVKVDGRALVPRPETEIVVEVALGELERMAAASPREPVRLALDLGTGSGVIALSLAAERSDLEVLAVDRSAEALSLARENLAELAVGTDPTLSARVRLAEGDWYAAVGEELRGRVDIVVANPPYLAEAEWEQLDPVVRDHDPYGALVAGPTGLEAIEAVVGGAATFLRPTGSVVAELAPAQAGAAAEVARAAGLGEVAVLEDLAGRPRVLRARRRPR
jgi:release factor glutamine methyltransferase